MRRFASFTLAAFTLAAIVGMFSALIADHARGERFVHAETSYPAIAVAVVCSAADHDRPTPTTRAMGCRR